MSKKALPMTGLKTVHYNIQQGTQPTTRYTRFFGWLTKFYSWLFDRMRTQWRISTPLDAHSVDLSYLPISCLLYMRPGVPDHFEKNLWKKGV